MFDVESKPLYSMPDRLSAAQFIWDSSADDTPHVQICDADQQEICLITAGRLDLLKDIAPKLSAKDLATEAGLTSTKWFDYNFIDPVTATKIFAAEYHHQYQRAWEKNNDREEAAKKRGLPLGDNFNAGRELTSLWRARQKADELGIPYDIFIREGIEACMRRKCKHLPRPNQLLDKRTLRVVTATWAERVAEGMPFSKLPQYRNEAFVDHPLQRAHHDWIVNLIKHKRSRPGVIGRMCFVEQVLTVERAMLEFGEEKVNDARDYLIGEVQPFVADAPIDLHPACFAVPRAYQTAGSLCSTCPVRQACRVAEQHVRAEVAHLQGSDDPAGDRNRAATAARVRKWREKKKLERGAEAV